MAIPAHTYKLDKKSLAKIEELLPRLKHSILPTKVIRWLENFNPEDVELAKDLLRVYEYITFDEFVYRLNDLLKTILDKIPKGEKIIIMPYGKIGKSGTFVTYPIKKTKEYSKREKDIVIEHDFLKFKRFRKYKYVIFIDDFIGSGKTFFKDYKKQDAKGNSIEKWITDKKINNVYILATIVMADGKKYLNKNFPTFEVVADVREKIFHPIYSPLNAFGNRQEIEAITLKYGNAIKVFNFPPYSLPFGYSKSQSLISYFHSTPNNTLPIIWGKNIFWDPLFPRDSKTRMDEAREFKKEVAFYIGICNRLGIDIFNGKSILEKKGTNEIRKIKHNNKQDHAVISLLILKNQEYGDIIICHILGLTMRELEDIYREAAKLSFTNKDKNITNKGNQFIVELKEKTKKENFREPTPDRLVPKDGLYIPKSFKRKDII